MKQQRNIFHTKEQDKTPKEELSDMETGNLLQKEFRVMIIKITKEFGRRMNPWNEKLSF